MSLDAFWRGERRAPVVVPEQSNTGHAQYDALPASIRATYTVQEWMWLSDAHKANLVQIETEQEWDE